MARYESRFVFQVGGGDWTTPALMMKDARDRLRAEMAGSSAVVSDIAQWTGYTTTIGYAFIVKDGLDEWLFVMGSGSVGGNIIGNRNSTTRNVFLRGVSGGNVSTSSSTEVVSVVYNCRKGSFQMGFSDPVACTYAAGDFQAPAFNPYSQLAQFIPSGILRGLSFANSVSSQDNNLYTFQIVYDDAHKSLMVVSSSASMPLPDVVYLSGQALTLLQVGDTDASFQGWISLSWGASSSGTIIGTPVAQVYDASGSPHDCQYVYANPFTLGNYILPDGSIDYVAVKIASGAYSKGYLHTDLVRVQGAANTSASYGTVFSGPSGPLVKYSADLAFMYKASRPIFPYDMGYNPSGL